MDRREAWRRDVQGDIDTADWEMACLKTKKQSIQELSYYSISG